MQRFTQFQTILYRGGTSKGAFLPAEQFDGDPRQAWEDLCRLMGTEDPREIDGLGGADPSTSKLAVMRRSARPGCHVDYLFGQAKIGELSVDFDGTCGNLSSAAALYAVEEGYATGQGEVPVTVYAENVECTIDAIVYPGRAPADLIPAGSRGAILPTGTPVLLNYAGLANRDLARWFPTGQRTEQIQAQGRSVRATLMNCVNPIVFLASEDLGIKGTETPREINGNGALLDLLLEIKLEARARMGMVNDEPVPFFPILELLQAPASYKEWRSGETITAQEHDLTARAIHTAGRLLSHNAIPLSSAIATGVACALPGTLLQSFARPGAAPLRIGHPSGVLHMEVAPGEGEAVKRVALLTTARRLMIGTAFLPKGEGSGATSAR